MNDDLISRQAAIDGFYNVKVHEEDCTEYDIGYNDGIDYAISKLSVMPSVQPERKGGKWIDNKCTACGKGIENLIDSREWYENEKPNYCPFCGKKFKESGK